MRGKEEKFRNSARGLWMMQFPKQLEMHSHGTEVARIEIGLAISLRNENDKFSSFDCEQRRRVWKKKEENSTREKYFLSRLFLL